MPFMWLVPSCPLFLIFIKKCIIIVIVIWLHWVFVAVQAFSSCGEQGQLFVVVQGFLIVVASLVAEHGL